MESNVFEVGDLVRLKCGSKTMVVDTLPTDGSNRINCVWHNEKGEPQDHWYASGALKKPE